jgi:mycofactocin precursor
VPNIVERAEGVTMSDKTTTITEQDATVPAEQDEALTEDLLVEEVSIDGMCGVY